MVLSPKFLASGHTSTLFDRELSWIAFNRRLIYEVADHTLPLLYRTLKLAEAALELDEYFMMRVPELLHPENLTALAPNQRIRAYLRPLVARQEALFTSHLQPLLAQHGIRVLHYAELTDIQRAQLHRRFEEELKPLLTPFITAPNQPTPDFVSLNLYLVVCLEIDQTPHLAWVKVPKVTPRFLVLADSPLSEQWSVTPIEQVIRAHLPSLFPDYTWQGAYLFRVTRSADLGSLDKETSNLMEKIQETLQLRQEQGNAVRLEVLKAMPSAVRSHLMHHLHLTPQDVYSLRSWLALRDLKYLTHLLRPDLQLSDWQPAIPRALMPVPKPSLLSLTRTKPAFPPDLFSLLQERDLLLHFPYHSFAQTIETFIAQAAADPDVLTLKVTLYRTAIDAPIVRSLLVAAKAGKQIVVLVELTAPLDEAINIHWAKSLSKAGAHVVYGVVGYRTHTNLALAVRREGEAIRSYAYIGTGDYLPDRFQPYEDLGLLTASPKICQELSYLFNFLTGCALPSNYTTLMVAPGQLRSRLQAIIEREIAHAQAGRSARLIAKLNLLADPDLISHLYRASQTGVVIDLIVRETCCLRPGVPGLSDRIQVISILGRNIEHSRILYCANGGQPEAWIGTADWTPRGLDERIEVMVPLTSSVLLTDLQQRLECWLADNQQAWQLQADGRYVRRQPDHQALPLSAQDRFMQQAAQ
jgi:polyphosphate kinase